jgi:hypothetical protein
MQRGMDNSGTARSQNVAEYVGYLDCSTGERSRLISARQ